MVVLGARLGALLSTTHGLQPIQGVLNDGLEDVRRLHTDLLREAAVLRVL
jgi:hypothetical protein